MSVAMMARLARKTSARALLVVVLAGTAAGAFAQGAPAARGGGLGGGATRPAPAAEVPQVVQMQRPSAEEVAAAREGLKSLDRKTKQLLDKYPGLIQVTPPAPMSGNTAIRPSLSSGFEQKHQNNLEVAKQGEANLLFMGDSITDFWRNEQGIGRRGGGTGPALPEGVVPYAGKAVQDKYFGQWKVANYGIAGDTTQGVLYRLQNGEGKGINPKAIMLMIGTNNTGRNSAGEIAEGIGACVLELQKDFPNARILLLGVFPRGNPGDAVRGTIADINKIISKLDDGKQVFYMDISKEFLDAQGNIPTEVMTDRLHPSNKGYEIWAKAVIEPITAMMNGKSPR